ncbi:SDR family oxidoreductase [Streptomyces sp. NPDC002172]
MKVVVFDDGGLMGVETALWVRDHGHEVGIVSAPAGFDALTPEEVADALHGCAVVIDFVRPPPATRTFPTENGPAGGLLRAAIAAGVRHHVCLSAVGVDRVRDDGAFTALRAREALIERSGIPHSILRSTQLFEAAEAIADTATEDGAVRVPPLRVQPVSLMDVAMYLAAHRGVPAPGRSARDRRPRTVRAGPVRPYRPRDGRGPPACPHARP